MVPTNGYSQSEEKTDFFMAVVLNPNFCLYDFLCVGLNAKNTELRSVSEYNASNYARIECQKRGLDIFTTYNKVKKAWPIFLQVQNTDVKEFGKYMVEYDKSDIFAPKCPNPALKQKLKTIPLKLDDK
jgi:hypothetical protein